MTEKAKKKIKEEEEESSNNRNRGNDKCLSKFCQDYAFIRMTK